jgi:hypothetical protein
MMRKLVWAAGLLLAGIVLAGLLMTNVYGDRGRGEIDLTSIHEVPVGPGGVVTQPVPLERPAPVAIDLPYQWLGSSPARIEVRVERADGAVLADTTETLDNSRAPLWLEPVADGSYWQGERAALHSLQIPSGAAGTIVLHLTRLDQEAGPLILFASDLPSPQSSPSRPPMVERPHEYLDLVTEYGAPRTAFAKGPTFVSRVQSLAPPWLPFPAPELLLAAMVVLGIVVYTMTLFARPDEQSVDVISRTTSR